MKQTTRTSLFYSITSSLVISLVTISGSGHKDIPAESPALQIEQVDVFVVNYPLAFFTKRLGDELVQITFPVPADQGPAYSLGMRLSTFAVEGQHYAASARPSSLCAVMSGAAFFLFCELCSADSKETESVNERMCKSCCGNAISIPAS